MDKKGNIYLTQLGQRGPDVGPNTVRRIDYETGIVTTVAGSGKMGRGGDGGPATEAEFDTACGVAVDDEGNIFVCCKWDSNIRRVDAKTGVIDRFAGYTTRHYPSEVGESRPMVGGGYSLGGFHGDGGPALEAAFNFPEHLAFDSRGDLYVCDNGNNRVRKIDMRTGITTTFLGTGQKGSNGDGGPATEASLNGPDAIFIDAHDNLYVNENRGFRIRKVDAETGFVETLVGTGVPGVGDEGLPGPETKISGCESGIWADPDGTMIFSDSAGRLRRYDGETRVVTTIVGGTSVHDGRPATKAFLSSPDGISLGPDGHIYFADSHHQLIRAIDPVTGVVRTVAGSGGRSYGGDNGPATEAYLYNPADVSVDDGGRVVIADSINGYVRRVDEDGVIRVLAGTGLGSDTGDGGVALSASLVGPRSVAHGPNGDIYIGDGAGRIRKVDAASGVITTVAGTGISGYTGDGDPATEARIGSPVAISIDHDGTIYFADAPQHVVRRVDAKGNIATIAGTGEQGYSPDGTPAVQVALDRPGGIALADDGTVYFSDSNNNRVRKITRDGTLETVAGGDKAGDAGDGGLATEASLNKPGGLCLYGDVLLISDSINNRIKAVRVNLVSRALLNQLHGDAALARGVRTAAPSEPGYPLEANCELGGLHRLTGAQGYQRLRVAEHLVEAGFAVGNGERPRAYVGGESELERECLVVRFGKELVVGVTGGRVDLLCIQQLAEGDSRGAGVAWLDGRCGRGPFV